MGTTRFSLSNFVDSATVLNSGAGAHGGVGRPSLDQDADFPMSNVTLPDRFTLWKSTGTLDPTDIDLDMGAAKQVRFVALLGFRFALPPAFFGFIDIYSSTTYAPAVWTNRGSIAISTGSRDFYLDIGSTINARYWRVEFHGASTSPAPWTLGRIWMAGNPTDLGILYSPGASRSPRRVRTTLETDGGVPVTFDKGDKRRRFVYGYQRVPDAIRSTLESLMDKTGSFFYLDHNDTPYEVRVDQELTLSHQWNNPPLWELSLTMEQLP